MSPAAPQPPRGLFSCLYSSCDSAPPESQDTHTVVVHLISDLYDEAFSRLPVDDMPPDVDLVRLVTDAGVCVGLLDPVSNIILNALSRLPLSSPPPPRPRTSKRKKALPKNTWRQVASASYHGLLAFMQSYFGCITKDQACRYLRWAGADLALAVVLTEHDLCAARPAPPDPASGRTHAALETAVCLALDRDAAALSADGLVWLAAARLPPARIEAVANVVAGGGRKLTLQEVNAIADLAQFLEKSICDAHVTLQPHGGGAVVGIRKLDDDEGVVTETTTSDLGEDGYRTTTTTVRQVGHHIASLRRPDDMDSMLSACLAQAAAVQRSRGLESLCARGRRLRAPPVNGGARN